VPLNVAAALSLRDALVMTVASRSTTIQPASLRPATVSHGKPPGAQVEQRPHVPTYPPPNLRDLPQGTERSFEGGCEHHVAGHKGYRTEILAFGAGRDLPTKGRTQALVKLIRTRA
jgi:hypothetical protein